MNGKTIQSYLATSNQLGEQILSYFTNKVSIYLTRDFTTNGSLDDNAPWNHDNTWIRLNAKIQKFQSLLWRLWCYFNKDCRYCWILQVKGVWRWYMKMQNQVFANRYISISVAGTKKNKKQTITLLYNQSDTCPSVL